MQQLKGDTLAFELLVDVRVVRLDLPGGFVCHGKQLTCQSGIIHPLRQRPRQALCLTQTQVLGDHPLGEAKGEADLLVA